MIALAALTAVMVPATLALGDEPIVGGEPGYVFLQMGSQDRVTFDTQVQPISTHKNRCTVVNFGEPELLELDAFGGELGHVSDSFGVRSSGDGNGEPCARVEASDGEAISVKLGTAMFGYLMTAVDVDLELKGNAVVYVEYLYQGSIVDDHTFDPESPSDDGPDSGDLDNWRYFHRPTDGEAPVLFDEVKFTPTNGTLSLEGGSDGTDPGSLDPGNNWSQFEVVPTYDGDINCGDTETISEEGIATSGDVTMHSENDGDGWAISPEICVLKPYNAWVEDDALAFVPELDGYTARYTIEVDVEDQAIIVDSDGMITSLIAVYDPTPSTSFPDVSADLPLPNCVGTPVLSGGGYDAFWLQADVGLLPDGASACWYHAEVVPDSADAGTEYWGIYFEDDPGLSFK